MATPLVERFCPVCYCHDETVTSSDQAYLMAIADVTLRGLSWVAAALCAEHRRSLTRHISGQLDALEYIKKERQSNS